VYIIRFRDHDYIQGKKLSFGSTHHLLATSARSMRSSPTISTYWIGLSGYEAVQSIDAASHGICSNLACHIFGCSAKPGILHETNDGTSGANVCCITGSAFTSAPVLPPRISHNPRLIVAAFRSIFRHCRPEQTRFGCTREVKDQNWQALASLRNFGNTNHTTSEPEAQNPTWLQMYHVRFCTLIVTKQAILLPSGLCSPQNQAQA
jgi:hypothetical protein